MSRIIAAVALTLVGCAAAAEQALAQINAAQGNSVSSAQIAGAERISAEDFGALPFMTNPRLSPDGTKVLAKSNATGRGMLVVIDLSASSLASHIINIPDKYDLAWYRWAGDNRILLSLGQSTKYFGEDAYATRLLMYELQTGKAKFIGKKDEGLDGDTVIHVDRDGRSLLLSIQKTIYDYPSVWRVDLNTLNMQEIESTSYRARDGLEIPAYITLPLGRETKSLPLVIMPHRGPFVRDEWGYDTWAQFLANRGYAVLQPNYRGSTGYGKEFVEKGMGQWGRAMQDDLDDGVKWLVDQGKIDPKRVCIMGASYGGYAAMWAAARNPDIYRCAISFAGISDVQDMLRYDRKTFSAPRYYRNWRERVQGEKKFDLDTVSPLRAADRISIPILITHGDKDENVPIAQSKKLHDALTKAKKQHEYVVYEGERHGFQKPEHAVDFLKRVDAFLSKYNPAE